MIDNLGVPSADPNSALRCAIERGQRVLLSTQLADGSWDERSDVGPMSTAMVLICLHRLNRLDPADRKDGARWLRAQQLRDGSFKAAPFARRGDLATTALGWGALQLSQTAEDRKAAELARDYVQAHGGMDGVLAAMRTGDVSAVFAAMAGILDPKRLPDPHLAWALVPGLVELVAKRVHFGIVMGALQLSLLARDLCGCGRKGWLGKRENERAAELIRLYQNGDGSWNSNTVQTAMALPALAAAGLPIESGPVDLGVKWLLSRRVRDASGLHFDVFASDVWSTAFSVRALLRTGMAPGDPRMENAVQWLLSRQLEIDQPWPNNRKKGAVRRGGWPFQTGNDTMADCDDAGIVLSAIGLALEAPADGPALAIDLAARSREAVERARTWLRDMQNPDGGWSAFVWGLPVRPDGPIMTRPLDLPPSDPLRMAGALWHPPPELGDPSTEDLTGRVLHGLGANGIGLDAAEVQKAIAFLRRHQTEFGGWWGRWVCNYVASTSYVLSALYEVGEDMQEAYVANALRWLLSVQNKDGGWGEGTDSYSDPKKAGKGPSTVPLTSLVVQALVDAGMGDRDPTLRAVEYILRKQRADGTWPNDDYVATNVPPGGFYYYAGAVRHMPLEALGRYARRHEQGAVGPRRSQGRWSSAVLGPARDRTDPQADAVVDAIFATGKAAAIGQLVQTIFKNDDPVPPGLPELAQRFFDETDALPPWADRARIVRAQKLFAQHGAQLTFGLFCSSLPQAYGAANGALVLTQTQAMTARTRQRIMETAQFLFDVLDVGGLDPKGRGIRAAQRVRLMHAGVRRLLLERGWDVVRLGKPINQEDMAGTLMTFSVVTFEAMRKLGVDAGQSEGDDWMHHWGVVGHLLGIEKELIPTSLRDAQDLMEEIRERQWAPSPQGKILAASLIDMMQEFFTHNLLDGLTPTLVRFLAGDQCGDILDVPRADWTKTVIGLGAGLAAAIDPDEREGWLEKAFGAAVLEAMKAIIVVEREGKQASFRIPTSLKKTVIPGT